MQDSLRNRTQYYVFRGKRSRTLIICRVPIYVRKPMLYIKMNSIEALLECITANSHHNFPAVWALLCGALQARFLRRAALARYQFTII